MKKYSYAIAILSLMVLFPLIFGTVEQLQNPSNNAFETFGKWFIFWGIGIRLFSAGISQTRNPGFTAKKILGIKDNSAFQVVRELGFANLAIGLLGILSPWTPGWLTAAALVGGVFLILDGIEHARKAKRGLNENVAMFTDLAIGIFAIIYVFASLY